MVQQTPLSLSVSRVHIWNVNGVVATTFGWGEMRCEVRSKAFMKVSQDGNEFCVSIMETGANCKPLELNGVFKAMLMITLRINKIFCLQFIHFILLYFILWGMCLSLIQRCSWNRGFSCNSRRPLGVSGPHKMTHRTKYQNIRYLHAMNLYTISDMSMTCSSTTIATNSSMLAIYYTHWWLVLISGGLVPHIETCGQNMWQRPEGWGRGNDWVSMCIRSQWTKRCHLRWVRITME